jgi:hypothetical protein
VPCRACGAGLVVLWRGGAHRQLLTAVELRAPLVDDLVGQGRQSDANLMSGYGLYVFSPHATWRDGKHQWPGLHGLQSICPTPPWYMPGGHASHVACLCSGCTVPASHCVGANEPSGHMDPLGHPTQRSARATCKSATRPVEVLRR